MRLAALSHNQEPCGRRRRDDAAGGLPGLRFAVLYLHNLARIWQRGCRIGNNSMKFNRLEETMIRDPYEEPYDPDVDPYPVDVPPEEQ
jgi:hypothetical protein